MSGVIQKCSGEAAVRGVVTACLALTVAVLSGCSRGTSRFDYPMFAADGEKTDSTTTASLPPEPVYGESAQSSNRTTVVKRDLPPPAQGQAAANAPASSENTRLAAANPRQAASYPQSARPVPAPAQSQGQTQPQPRWREQQEPAKEQTESRSQPRPQSQPQPQPQPQPQAGENTETPAEPAPTKVTVRRGDTLYALSKRHGVSIQAIMAANDMRNSRLSIGEKLTIPGGNAEPVTKATYTVQRGDSVARIARVHGVDPQMLARYNGISRPSLIQPGQVLKIPGEPEDSESQAVASARDAAEESKEQKPVRVASREGSVPVPASKPERESGNKPVQKVAARTDAMPRPEPMSGNQFRWPVRGRVIAGFGSKENGQHNDGINVAVPSGTAVKAVENGVVAYAGSELEPYGNLILIRHANDWVSAYAHNDELLVKRGDTVRRGQVISKAGQSGSVSQPQLHFELRKGSRPVDPLQYMASS